MDTIIPIKITFSEHLSEHHISKNMNFSLPLILLILGVVLIFVPLPSSFSGETAIIFKWLVVFSTIAIGVIMFLRTPKFRYQKTGKLITFKQIYFDSQDHNYVMNCLTNKPTDSKYTLKKGSTAGLLLKVFVEDDRNFLAAQLSEYVPYAYVIATEPYYFHGEEAQRVCKALTI